MGTDASALATRLLAAYQFFNTLVPALVVFVHLLVVATWLGPLDCDTMPVAGFWFYWASMIAVTAALSTLAALKVNQPARLNRAVHVVVSVALSTLLFVTASFIRAKPFKCFEDGAATAYLFGPVGFGLVLAAAAAFALALALTHRLDDLEPYLRIGGGAGAAGTAEHALGKRGSNA